MLGLLGLLGFGLALLITLLSLMLMREMRRPPRRTAAYAIARQIPADPGDLNLQYQEWTLDLSDGARLPVWEIAGHRAHDFDHDPITAVFVHGWGHSRIDSLGRIQPFLPLVDRLVMYDLRGHGDSSGGLSRLADDEHLDLLALLERLGGERFLLIGHSMGAVIAIHAALQECRAGTPNPRVAGVIAYAPYCEFHESLRGRLRVAGYPRRPITDLALAGLALTGIRPSNLSEREIAEVNCPLLIIHGQDDIVTPIAHGRRLSAACENVTLHEIAGANHTDAHVRDTEGHDVIVREFIESLSVAAPLNA
jgi:pimeloyl-ACP methyl ester carboxylesterase